MKTLTGWGEVKNVKPPAPSKVEVAVRQAVEAADVAHPAYRRELEKLEKVLKLPLTAVQQRRTELLAGLGRKAENDDLTARAKRLLAGAPPPPAEEERQARIYRDLDALGDEETLLRRAMDIQAQVMQHERAIWSKLVCDQLDAVYRAQVKKIAAGLALLGEADKEHVELFNALRDHEVSISLRPMFFRVAGHGDLSRADLSHSPAWHWFKDAREHGLLGE